MPIEVNGTKFDVRLAGRADRIDSLDNGMLRVIDYKTGKPKLGYGGIEALFHGEPVGSKRESNIINTLLYSMMLRKREGGRDVRPELYYVGAMVHDDYSPRFIETVERKSRTLDAYSECAEEFEAEVEATLIEMFDRTEPFMQCEDESPCSYCDYNSVCRRG